MEFLDVAIFYLPSDGSEWAKFLQNKLNVVGMTSELIRLEENAEKNCAVNIVLASPDILNIDSANPIKSLNIENSLMVLLGVDEYDLIGTFVKQLKFKDIFQWDLFVAETKESVSSLDSRISSLLHKVRHDSTTPCYDQLPAPRPTQPQLRRAVPYHHISKLHVAMEFHDEKLNVFILNNRKGSEEVEITFDSHLDFNNTTAMLENKALYRLQLPDDLIFKNDWQFIAFDTDQICGTGTIPKLHSVESVSPQTAEEIIQDIFGNREDPIPLLCRILGISDFSEYNKTILDNHLAEALQNIATGQATNIKDILNLQETEYERWPTLLHLAAEYDLILFGAELLKNAFSFEACLTMNTEKESPQMIAKRNGFIEFATMIQQYIKAEVLRGHTTKKDSGIVDEKKLPTISEHHHEIEQHCLTLAEETEVLKCGHPDIPQNPTLFQRIKKKLKKRKNSTNSDPLPELCQNIVIETQQANTDGTSTMHRSQSSVDTTRLVSTETSENF